MVIGTELSLKEILLNLIMPYLLKRSREIRQWKALNEKRYLFYIYYIYYYMFFNPC